jgi:hypothetical protein
MRPIANIGRRGKQTRIIQQQRICLPEIAAYFWTALVLELSGESFSEPRDSLPRGVASMTYL